MKSSNKYLPPYWNCPRTNGADLIDQILDAEIARQVN
jgi:hypothetical protein